MNGPINRPAGAPSNWLCNAKAEHGVVEYRYNHAGRVELVTEPCRCSVCLRGKYPELYEGRPVGSGHEWDAATLAGKGYVGLYRRRRQ